MRRPHRYRGHEGPARRACRKDLVLPQVPRGISDRRRRGQQTAQQETPAQGGQATGRTPAFRELLPERQQVPSGAAVQQELTPYELVTTYNNFYEFGTDKNDPSENSDQFQPLP